MKPFFILIIIFQLFSSSLKAQEPVKVLITKNEDEVVNYLNSLIQRSDNKELKIERSISDNGALTIQLGVPLNENDKFGFLDLTFVFHRFQKEEICVTQLVMGSPTYIYSNLSFIKDKFEFISSNNWQLQLGGGAYITAIYDKRDNESCAIIYKLKFIK